MNTPNSTDNVYQNATERLIRGVDKVADAVKITLGAAGSNAILQSDLRPFHRVTNDGVSIAESIILTDRVENMGANIIKEIAQRSDKESGDGTTTATTLAQAILHAGRSVKEHPMSVKRSLDACLPIIFEEIDKQKREITVDDVDKVAIVSGESEELGALIKEIYQKIGKEGIIELDNSNLPTTHYELTDGVRLRNAGYLGQYSCTEVGKAVYKNPPILISKEKIQSVTQLEDIFRKADQGGIHEMVLYCEEIDMGVASRLALTHLNGGFKTLIIQAPTLWKTWLYEDFAALTGATPIDFSNGKTFKNFQLPDFGTCDKVISTKDETRLIGTRDISDHLERLKEAGKTDDQQLLRASWLQTKVAILKMGANSDSELSYKRLKAIDAISASKLALEDGVVAGGGVTLANVAAKLPTTIGGNILSTALRKPFEQIALNAGYTYPDRDLPENHGLDARTNNIVDMWEAGIVDPAKVVKNSVKNAISVAGTILTAPTVVTLPK